VSVSVTCTTIIFNYGSQLAKSLRRKQSCYSATGYGPRFTDLKTRIPTEDSEGSLD
jgi:hypothetical protein